jgi:hypothetical protein
MAYTTQQLIQMGFGGYAGWDDNSANDNFMATGGAGNQTGGGGASSSNIPSVDDYISAITETLPKPPPKYSEANPFYFDEQSARELATAEFSPCYDEMLKDYLTDVDTTRERLGQDTPKMLSELERQKTNYMAQNEVNLNRTLEGIQEGYANKGLYFSGFKNKSLTQEKEDNQRTIGDYLGSYGYKVGGVQTDSQRRLQDLALGSERQDRDINRQKTTAIEGGVQTQKREALDEYLYGMEKYYQNPNYGGLT